jgi:carbon starvation protein CstA
MGSDFVTLMGSVREKGRAVAQIFIPPVGRRPVVAHKESEDERL